jgi:hypothetical protein
VRDYYEILMVHERAIPEVIDRVYRLLARRYHPDVHPPEERSQAQRLMTELNLAYQVLSDREQREEYDRLRRQGISVKTVPEDPSSVELLLKCFNHPQRPAMAFCWDCGRPICSDCVSPNPPLTQFEASIDAGRTICETCVRHSTDLASRMRAGRRADPQGRWLERPMGLGGALLYYAALGLVIAGLTVLVLWAALQAGAYLGQAQVYAGILGLLLFLLAALHLALLAHCPHCGSDSSPLDFRRIAPWRDLLSPHPVCPQCGRHFLKQEVTDSFD